MFLPLRHENMQGRRWPVVTFALIALNIIAFLATHGTIEAEDHLAPERVEVRKHPTLAPRKLGSQSNSANSTSRSRMEKPLGAITKNSRTPAANISQPQFWLELCRVLEGQQNFDRAVAEYDKLASAYPNDKQSLLALMAAGRLSLKKLGRPAEALHFYRAASTSAVPHLDWESNIQAGIKEATATLAQSAVHAE
jgi:tetratricopeptide (TPR) repeat protein